MKMTNYTERLLDKAYFQGTITRAEYIAGLQRIATVRHARNMANRLQVSMSSSTWIK